MQNNLEELEKENKTLKEKLKFEENLNTNLSYNNTADTTRDKLLGLKNELEKNKKVLKSYEIQNLKLSENERKLKSKLVKELKLMNQKDIRFKSEIEILKQKLSLSEKKLQILLGEEYINSNNYNNFEQNNFSPNSNIKRSNSNLIKDPENNAYISNTNIKKSKTLLNKTKKNNIPLSNLSNNNKLFYYNKVLEESKNVSRTHRTNQK